MTNALFPPTARYLVDGHEVDIAYWLDAHRRQLAWLTEIWALVDMVPGDTIRIGQRGDGQPRYTVTRIANADLLALDDADYTDAANLWRGQDTDGNIALLIRLARAVRGAPWPDLGPDDRHQLLETLAFTADETLALVEAHR